MVLACLCASATLSADSAGSAWQSEFNAGQAEFKKAADKPYEQSGPGVAAAESHLRKALSIAEANKCPAKELGNILYWLARTCAWRQEPKEAKTLYERALSIRRKGTTGDTIETAECLGGICAANQALGLADHAATRKQLEYIYQVYSKFLPDDDEHFEEVLPSLGAYAKSTKAVEYYQQLLKVMEKKRGKNSPRLTLEISLLAAALSDVGRHTEAAALYEREAALLEKSPDNRSRVGQRRNCGLGEADYLRLKALTCMLPL